MSLRRATARSHPASPALASQRGESLVGVLVAVMILGIVAFFLSNTTTFNAKVLNQINQRNDFEDARRVISAQVDCTNTLKATGGGCPGGEIALYSAASPTAPNGVIIVPKGPAYKKWGNYQLHATCTGGASVTIDVQMRQAVPSVGGWQDLFPTLPFQC